MQGNPIVYLGIDVGGTGIKAALVDVQNGQLASEKLKILTPKPATPEAVLETIKQAIDHFDYAGPVGCGFPSVIKDGIVLTATNLDPSWINIHLEEFLSQNLGLPFYALNDADAAGLGEVNFGCAKGVEGLVVMITLGTGVGSGMYYRSELIPNTELGFLTIKGGIAEKRVSNSARVRGHLGWIVWAKRLNEYLNLIEKLFSPQLIVLGGGISKKYEMYNHILKIDTSLKPALLQNNAGCIGAALFAYRKHTTATSH